MVHLNNVQIQIACGIETQIIVGAQNLELYFLMEVAKYIKVADRIKYGLGMHVFANKDSVK
jgi:hypothetical protein